MSNVRKSASFVALLLSVACGGATVGSGQEESTSGSGGAGTSTDAGSGGASTASGGSAGSPGGSGPVGGSSGAGGQSGGTTGAGGGVVAGGWTGAGGAIGGSTGAGGGAIGGSTGAGGGAIGGSTGAGGATIDCSTVGCGAPPVCGQACSAPCGCCPCADGTWQGELLCQGGCWATAPAVDGGSAPSCEYLGQTYAMDVSFPAGDGCNTCQCMPEGKVGCTKMACTCDPAAELHRRAYVGTPEQCPLIDYVCPANTTPFANACGCGCEQADTCPEWFNCMPGPGAPPCDEPAIHAECPYSGIAY